MQQDNTQFLIPDNYVSVDSTHTEVESRTEIGNAKVVLTLFGNAKVRVTRKQDSIRRTWLLITLAVTIILATAWLVWGPLQFFAQSQTESLAGPAVTILPTTSPAAEASDPAINVEKPEKKSP